MIALVGHSGAGKDTVLNILMELGYEAIVSYTTRPARNYESNGLDYHFVSDGEFEVLKNNGFFAETQTYRGWQYGIAKRDCIFGSVAIVDPARLKQLQKIIKNIIVIYVMANESVRIERLCSRGDDPVEIERRIKADKSLHADTNFDLLLLNNKKTIEELRLMIYMFDEHVLRPYVVRHWGE